MGAWPSPSKQPPFAADRPLSPEGNEEENPSMNFSRDMFVYYAQFARIGGGVKAGLFSRIFSLARATPTAGFIRHKPSWNKRPD